MTAAQERREKRNNWDDLQAMPYPRLDDFARRVTRWGMAHFFDMASLTVSPENDQVRQPQGAPD